MAWGQTGVAGLAPGKDCWRMLPSLVVTAAVTVGFALLCGSTFVGSHDSANDNQLPYCPPHQRDSLNQGARNIVFVTTLDGTFSALDPNNGGSVLWSLETEPGEMLSSSISNLDYYHKGEKIRLIPSLNGGLYRFNGESVEPVPFTAESLLQSSFKFSDDLIMTGGKESRTYGMDLDTGRLRYVCSMEGCHNESEEVLQSDRLLVLRRQTQTVRAVEPRAGQERWNFSISQHQAMVLGERQGEGCMPQDGEEGVKVAVVVPEGVVCGMAGQQQVVWKQQFDKPIVQAWQLQDGRLREINLFETFTSGGEDVSEPPGDSSQLPPVLYIGTYNNMMYIQETKRVHEVLINVQKWPQLTWKPYDAPPGVNHQLPINLAEKRQTTALSVLAEDGLSPSTGFFLYENDADEQQTDFMLNGTGAKCEESSQEEETEDSAKEDDFVDTPVEIIIVGLGYWWKEVVTISIITAVVMNLLSRPLIHHLQLGLLWNTIINMLRYMIGHRKREILVIPLAEPTPCPVIANNTSSSSTISASTTSDSSGEFRSRYLTDFEPVSCLGKGGFGLVCEAKNKIDDCHYAVKRICLPSRAHSRQRVLREVKALAKLEHHNIVRYYNAWVECPPAGWQEEVDRLWLASECMSTPACGWESGLTSKLASFSSPGKPLDTTTTTNNSTSIANGNLLRGKNDDVWVENEVWRRGKRENHVRSQSDISIVFASGTKSYSLKEEQDKSSGTKWSISASRGDSGMWMEAKCKGKSRQRRRSENQSDEFIVFQATSERVDQASRQRNSLTRKSHVLEQNGGSPASPKAFLYIQMQLCRKDSLQDWMRTNILQRDAQQVFSMFNQIVHAVEYIHLQGLIHRDLKPSNIFFAQDGQVKVGDFGLVTEVSEQEEEDDPNTSPPLIRKHTDRVGTLLYMSPEQEKRLPYNHKVDVYSLGLILFELLMPFETQMERLKVMTELRRLSFPPTFNNCFPQEFQLLQKMLSHDPDERPTTYGIRASPSLINIQDPSLNDIPVEMHFSLPHRLPANRSSSSSST